MGPNDVANPIGSITMWSGALVDVPAGWQQCDGTNGTPDLRERFILGSGGAVSPGQTGGVSEHTHLPGWAVDAYPGEGVSAWQAIASAASSNVPPYYSLIFIQRMY